MCTLFVEPRANGRALGNVGMRRAALLDPVFPTSNAAAASLHQKMMT